MPFPFHIVQSPKYDVIYYEHGTPPDGVHLRQQQAGSPRLLHGRVTRQLGRGHAGCRCDLFTDKTWFDKAGNFHSDALHVVERYTYLTPNHLNYEATIEDPKGFTRPWKISLPLYRRLEKNVELLDY